MGMVEYINYPLVLPNPQSSFSGTHRTPTQVTQFTSGRRRRRKIGRTVVKEANMEWLFTPDEYDIFVKWWEEDLNAGCSMFQINMSSGGSGQTGLHVVQLVGDPSFSHEECNWRVSVECIIHPYPKMTNEQMMYAVFKDPESFVSGLTDIVNTYYTRTYA